MKITPERDKAKPDNAVNRMGYPIDAGNFVIGQQPKIERLISRPNGDAAGAGPEYIFVSLVAEKKPWIVTSRPVDIVLALGALQFKDVKQKMPPAKNGPGQTEVAKV